MAASFCRVNSVWVVGDEDSAGRYGFSTQAMLYLSMDGLVTFNLSSWLVDVTVCRSSACLSTQRLVRREKLAQQPSISFPQRALTGDHEAREPERLIPSSTLAWLGMVREKRKTAIPATQAASGGPLAKTLLPLCLYCNIEASKYAGVCYHHHLRRPCHERPMTVRFKKRPRKKSLGRVGCRSRQKCRA